MIAGPKQHPPAQAAWQKSAQPSRTAPQPREEVPPNRATEENERLCRFLEETLRDAQQGYSHQRPAMVAEAARRISNEAGGRGMRSLARMAGCVERAASKNDMDAVKDLLPDLQTAIERSRIELTS